jgi:acyl-CoA synthetase (AMP-forming)/AMP-acid ligase II
MKTKIPAKIIDYLIQHTNYNSDALFLNKIETDCGYSYADLLSKVKSYCQSLENYGFKKDQRILYLADNNWNIFPLMIACSVLGSILVPVNPDLHYNDMKRIIEDVEPSLVIGSITNLNKCEVNLPRINILELNLDGSKYNLSKDMQDTDNTVLIIYTSGSSGQCKGVTISEQNIISAASSIIEFYKISASDKFYCVLPLYHMNAIMVTGMVPLLCGASIILSDVFNYTNAMFYFNSIEKYRPTILSLIPSIMSVLIKIEEQNFDCSTIGVRFSFCGAAPLIPSLWQEFEQKFNIPVYQGYGLTETTFWASLTPTDDTKDYHSVGMPYNCKIKIDFDATSSEVGEVLIDGSCVTKGYLNNKSGFDKNGYFRTGDLGYIGANGQLYIVGRLKDIIIKNGINIYPQGIDSVIISHPEIEDCGTVGLEHDISGEQVCTICVTLNNKSISERTVKDFAKQHLSIYMVPDRVLFTDKLPRGATGKIVRSKLIELGNNLLIHKRETSA